MKIRLEFEVEPKEVVEFLQRLSEQSGDHKQGANSKIQIGETVKAVLSRDGEEKRHVD